MKRICRISGQEFTVTDDDQQFLQKVSPLLAGKKYLISPPTLAPDERKRRRMAWRNGTKLYSDICDLTGKPILSVFSPDKPFQVYSEPAWWGDSWDAITYGRDFDFSRPFFAQYYDLMLAVPQVALITDYLPNINSEYINLAGPSKNCYLIFDTGDCEGCMYSHGVYRNLDCLDCDYVHDSSYCYDCVNCYTCYQVQHAYMCFNTTDSEYVFNLRGCKNCFLSHNLQQKEYYILNKPYTKETYFAEVARLKKELPNIKEYYLNKIVGDTTVPRKYYFGTSTENATGEYLNHVKNVQVGFNLNQVEDCAYVRNLEHAKDCRDYDMWGWDAELNYECQETGSGAYCLAFCSYCWDSVRDMYYTQFSRWSHHLFGCFGLKRKEYCILNKQYSKEQYEALVPRIIAHMTKTGEWGEFFPMNISHFGYNETYAQEHFPLNKEEAVKTGAQWCDYEAPRPQVSKVIPGAALPDTITGIGDDILDCAIASEENDKLFRIIKPELAFYRKYNIPLPRKSPELRHQERSRIRNPEQLWARNCMNCQKSLMTSYAPNRKEIIYCETCKQTESAA
ncbi:MAG: hypothetical protein HY817_05345 [Candidatus Abawacabacteria bacterium]|nr:hypothetical protein [Candidatus Abawacabacteria bacterium]